jgi:histidinol-phosphatase (PHP family)
MALPADYHMHTPLCRHAEGEPTEYAAHALAVGLTEIGFSDHSPMREDDFDDWRMFISQLDEYVEKVRKAQVEHPQLTIKLALEIDYIPGHEDWIRELAARHPWDYFIGSVHYVSDDWEVDHPDKLSEWRSRDTMEVWETYFERLTAAAESGLFEIIGHADLVKKFCFYPDRDCSRIFDRFLRAAAASETAIELNTAGLRKDCREIYPARHLLRMAYERGVRITFGADAHAPAEVGMNFAEAIQLAKAVGYRHWNRYTARQHTYARL